MAAIKKFLLLILWAVAFLSYSCDTKWELPRKHKHPGPPSDDLRPLPDFDCFVLVFQWPNSYCRSLATQKNMCNPPVPVQDFTILALWPVKNGRQIPRYCKPMSTPTNLVFDKLGGDLLTYWPQLANAGDLNKNRRFWHSQWVKHGACPSNKFSAEEYFKMAIRLATQYHPQEMLLKREIKSNGTSYNSGKILRAILADTEYKANIGCSMDNSGKVQLYQIQLCFNADGMTSRHCTFGIYRCKEQNPIFLDVPPTPCPTT